MATRDRATMLKVQSPTACKNHTAQYPVSQSENSSLTVFPKYAESLSASSVLGTNLLFSMAKIVWRLTPMALARLACEMRRSARSTLILLFIPQPFFLNPTHPPEIEKHKTQQRTENRQNVVYLNKCSVFYITSYTTKKTEGTKHNTLCLPSSLTESIRNCIPSGNRLNFACSCILHRKDLSSPTRSRPSVRSPYRKLSHQPANPC